MTGVPLSEISGCVIEKNECPIHHNYPAEHRSGGCNCYEVGIENATIDLQSSTRLTLSRERLAKLLFNTWFACGHFKNEKWENTKEDDKESWRIDADAIIQSLPELLEVVKE